MIRIQDEATRPFDRFYVSRRTIQLIERCTMYQMYMYQAMIEMETPKKLIRLTRMTFERTRNERVWKGFKCETGKLK